MSLGFVTPSIHPVPQRVLDRIFDGVDTSDPNECWIWKKSVYKATGYGQASWGVGGGKSTGTTAHRVAWMAANGDIPEGDTVDHKCRNRPCINPGHLRLLSNEDNARDNGQQDKTHCPRGHEYNEKNTYIDPDGARRCRPCGNITKKEWIEKRRQHERATRSHRG